MILNEKTRQKGFTSPWMINVFIAVLVITYIFSLTMSTAHLARGYSRFDESAQLGGIPLSWGVAIALELSVFVMSMISTYLGFRASIWATVGSLVGLSLIWFGNFRVMQLSGSSMGGLEVVVWSGFVPLSTLVVGKVLGDLISLRDQLLGGLVSGKKEPVVEQVGSVQQVLAEPAHLGTLGPVQAQGEVHGASHQPVRWKTAHAEENVAAAGNLMDRKNEQKEQNERELEKRYENKKRDDASVVEEGVLLGGQSMNEDVPLIEQEIKNHTEREFADHHENTVLPSEPANLEDRVFAELELGARSEKELLAALEVGRKDLDRAIGKMIVRKRVILLEGKYQLVS